MTAGTLYPTHGFLDLPPEHSELATAAVCILPVPYDATASFQPGARFGPAALIAASHQVELYDEQLDQETYRVGIHTCEPVRPSAGGPEAMVAAVRQACEQLLDAGKFVVVVGGEHTVALGAIAAHRQQRGNRAFGVVQFDAHRDLRDRYDATAWSHACVAARIVELQLPLAQVGVRAWSTEEQAATAGNAAVASITARALANGEPGELLDPLLAGLPEQIYLTFDLDVLDPSIMPSTGTPEPGGLLWYQTLALLEAVTRQRQVIGFDLVELAPIAGLVAPDFLAARLLYRLLGLIAQPWPALQKRG